MSIVGWQAANAQTYCEYLFGFAWCGPGWAIDDITFGSFTESNSACNSGPYSNQTSTVITVNKGTPIPFSLGTGGVPVQWGIWVDLNGDGDFTDATDYFWGSSSASATVSGSVIIPSGTTISSTRIRFASRQQSLALVKADACNFGYQAETQDFTLLMNAAGGCNIPTTLSAFATSTSAILSWDNVGTMYNLEYGLTGFAPGSGTTLNLTTNSASISSLTPNTYYDFYVQTDCSLSTADSSSWNGPYAFTTECTPFAVFPFLETFDGTEWVAESGYSYNGDTISTCWDRSPDSYNSSNPMWITRTGPGTGSTTIYSGPLVAASGSNYMLFKANGNTIGSEATLTSPQFNTTSLTTPWVSFKYHMYGSQVGILYLEVSTNGGANWTTLDSLVGQQQIDASNAWLERGVDVSSYSGANVSFRLRSKKTQTGYRGDIGIDDFSVQEAPNCPQPANFSLQNITGSSVDAVWNSNSNLFYIEIGTHGFIQGTGNIDTVTTTTHTFSSLDGDTYYDVYIQSSCTSTGNGLSAWYGPYTFRTILRPEFVEDFNTNGFLPNERWSETEGLISNPTSFTNTYSNWAEDAWLNTPPNIYKGSVRCEFNTYNGNVDEWFMTEQIDLGTGNNWELYFDMAATASGTSGPATLEADDTVKVVISTDGGLTWNNSNTLFTASQATNLTNTGATYTVNLTGYSGIVKIGFYCESTVANTSAVDVFVDNIGIRTPQACPTPTAITTWNINATDLMLGWSGSSKAIGYTVEYGPAGFTQGTGTIITGILADSLHVINLTPVTNYDFYVTADCDSSVYSIAGGPLSVTTGCPAIFATPYYDNFDLNPVGPPPGSGKWATCWEADAQSIINNKYSWRTSQGKASWATTGPDADHTQGPGGEGVYMFTEASYTGVETWITNGPFDLSSLTTPTLSFWYHMYGSQTGSVQVEVSKDNATWTEIKAIEGEQQTAGSDAWLKSEMALSQFLNDTIYIRFKGIKGSGGNGDMAIDDVSIDNSTNCIAPTGLMVTSRTTTSADLAWGSYEAPYTIEWGLTGFIQGTGTGNVVSGLTNANYSLTGLTAATAYDFYVKDTCNNIWVGPHTFMTECNGPMSGTYTIGGTPGANNFTGYKEAILALTNCGVSGPVTFNLSGGKYSGYLDFGPIPGASATNTVTFNGSGNDTIFGTGAGYAINFNGAGYITLNNLRITGYAPNYLIWLNNASHDISIENCILTGKGSKTSAAPSASAVIVASLLETSSTASGQNAFNINISGNTFNFGYRSICMTGDGNTPNTGLTITDNVFNNPYNQAVRITGYDSVLVSGNYSYDGLDPYSSTGLYMTGVNEFSITGNYFAGKNSGIEINSCNNNVVSQNSVIANNMLVGLKNGTGLYISNTEYLNIYFNSASGGNRGVYLYGFNNTDHFDIRNNIFSSQSSYALYSNLNGTDITIDYNLYYNSGNDFVYDNNSYANLAAWKTAKPTLNMNSLEGNPYFTSADDLHIIGFLPNDAGVAIPGYNVDYDGDTRPATGATSVDIGADEFTPKNNDIAIETFLEPAVGCGDSIANIIVLVRNYGLNTVNSVGVQVDVTGDINASVNTTYTTAIASLDYASVNVGSINTFQGASNVNFKAYSSLTNDEDSANDTAHLNNVYFIGGLPDAHALDTICYNPLGSVTLAAKTYNGVDYGWYSNVNDSIPYAVGDTITVPMSTQNSWYLGYIGGLNDSLQSNTGFTAQFGTPGGIMFNLTAKTSLVLDSLYINSRVNVGDTGTLYIHYIPNGTYVNNETNPSAWTVLDTVEYVSLGTGNKTVAVLNKPLSIGVGATYAIYLEFNGAWGNASSATIQNSPMLNFVSGTGLFSSFSSASEHRVFDGTFFVHNVVCSDTKTAVNLVFNTDTAQASFSTIVSQPNKVDVDASASSGQVVTWQFGDGNVGSGVIASHTYTNGGNYTIICTVEDTVCNTIDTATFKVNMTIGVQENELSRSLNIFPNPSAGIFNVSLSLDSRQDVSIKTVDALGRILFSESMSNAEGTITHQIDLSGQAPSVYFVHITAGDKTVVKKITKM